MKKEHVVLALAILFAALNTAVAAAAEPRKEAGDRENRGRRRWEEMAAELREHMETINRVTSPRGFMPAMGGRGGRGR